MVPEGWEIKALKDILSGSIRNGFSPIASDKETGFWVLGLGSLGDEGINVTEIKPVEPTDRVLQTKLSHGDFLVSRSNTPDKVGRSVYFRGEIENCSYPDLMMKFRIDESKAYPLFIEQKLKSSDVRAFFKNCAAGSSATMVKINKVILEKTPLLLPNINEQKKITQVLSTWDKAIATTEQLLVNSKQQKKALMQKILTGRDHFSEFTEKWKRHELSDIAMVQMGSSPKSEAYNEDGYGLPLIQGNADIKNRRSAPRIFTAEITKECNVGDILLSVRAPVGTVALSSHKACIGRGISAIRATVGFSQDFLYQWFLWFEPRWRALSQGSTFESINSDDIKQLKIELPGMAEQNKIASILSNADQEIELLQQKLNHLKQEKKALMQQLLTGKRRVKVDAE